MNYRTIEQGLRRDDGGRAVRELCQRTLTDIVTGRYPLAGVRHPLGFVCLPVDRSGDLGVCVHVWTDELPSAASTTSTMHSHSWDLLSLVLYGVVGNVRLDVTEDPAGDYRIYEVHSGEDFDELRATPRLVRCAERDRVETAAEGTYRLPAGEFHESVLVGGVEAATVVLGRGRGGIDLSIGPPQTPTHRIPRQRCDAAESARAARIVLERLPTAAGKAG